ncbi:MAG: DUF202 domain-containing protein [Nocardioides sp.]|nr:DUF202 domain-containing protein [Nocardioides sp.]
MTRARSGLQPERTAMAWQRTALGIGGVSALLVHHAEGRVALALPGGVGLAGALVLLVLVEQRYQRTIRKVSAGDSPMGPGLVRWTAFGTVLLSLAATGVVVGTAAWH